MDRVIAEFVKVQRIELGEQLLPEGREDEKYPGFRFARGSFALEAQSLCRVL